MTNETLFAVADRKVTADLFALIKPIAAGDGTAIIATTAPTFIRELFPDLPAETLDRISALVHWTAYVAHTATAVELNRRWKRNQLFSGDIAAQLVLKTLKGALKVS